MKKLDRNSLEARGDVLVTTSCPVECDQCLYSCVASKDPKKWMPEKTIRRIAKEYSKNKIGIRVTGGEPFYNFERLKKSLKIFLEYFDSSAIWVLTSGFWATSRKETEEKLKILKDIGLIQILLSVDRVHQKKVSFEKVKIVIESCQKLGIDVTLRMLLDHLSSDFIEKISGIIAKYELKYAVASVAWIGNAERNYDEEIEYKDYKKMRNLLDSKVKGNTLRLGKSLDFLKKQPSDFEYNIPKNKRLKYGRFGPTVFPNGNVYGCSLIAPLTFMGNINTESLTSMIEKFKGNMAGQVLLDIPPYCQHFNKFIIPSKNGFIDTCEICKEQPFMEMEDKKRLYGKEAIRKEYIIVDENSNLDEIYKKILNSQREILLSIRFSRKNLTQIESEEIISFLEKLKTNNIHFTISRPITKCLLGKEHKKIIEKFNIPKNCFECHELFSVEDEYVRLCPTIYNKKGPKFLDMKNRNDIFDEFSKFHKKLKPMEKCDDCIYFMRNQCNGMCFRE